MQLWKKMKKNRKGFTLVEIIVVLVILAILAAFTIPAMLGFVQEARGKALIAEAREVYVAYQSAATEVGASATDGDKVNAKYTSATPATVVATPDPTSAQAVSVATKALSYFGTDLTGTKYEVTIAAKKVTEVKYQGDGTYITLVPGKEAVVTKGTF